MFKITGLKVEEARYGKNENSVSGLREELF
jgi:hypothetical protein